MPEIGKRIRARRTEIGMTQLELATKMGYKDKSTIAKIENGTNDITQTKVVEFAKALDTSIAYLMGWEENDNVIIEENPALIELAKKVALQKRLMAYITKFQALTVEHQIAVESMIDFLYNEERKEKNTTLNA